MSARHRRADPARNDPGAAVAPRDVVAAVLLAALFLSALVACDGLAPLGVADPVAAALLHGLIFAAVTAVSLVLAGLARLAGTGGDRRWGDGGPGSVFDTDCGGDGGDGGGD